MQMKTEPSIDSIANAENKTKITFKPQLSLFSIDEIPNDMIEWFYTRSVGISGMIIDNSLACLPSIKVKFNNKIIDTNTFEEYNSSPLLVLLTYFH